MPSRPLEPNLANILTDALTRLRAVERQRLLGGGDGSGDLQTFEDGSPLGDTRFLDFGPNIDAVLIGDGFVRISAAATAPEFDAIVDSTLVTSQPTNRLFKGIGEALTYLGPTGLALNRALVLVRPGTYVETSDWKNPPNVYLFGNGAVPYQSLGNTVSWDVANFVGTTTASGTNWNLHMQDIEIANLPVSKPGWFSLGAGSSLTAYRCTFPCTSNAATTAGTVTNGMGIYVDCSFISGICILGSTVYITNCDLSYNNGGTRSIVASTTFSLLTVYGLSVWGGGGATMTISLPDHTTMYFSSMGSRKGAGGTGSSPLTFTHSGGGTASIFIDAGASSDTDTLVNLNFSGTTYEELIVRGRFNDVTIPAGHSSGQPLRKCRLDLQLGGTLDVSGPASVSVSLAVLGKMIIRGRAVNGTVDYYTLVAGLGAFTLLDYIGATYSCLLVSADGTGGGVSAKPYNFNAASTDNVLVIAGRPSYTAAGTDAGTNNRVLPEGAAPIPPTAGWGGITNVTTDRAYDADVTTQFELADVLGTLVADLIARGILAP